MADVAAPSAATEAPPAAAAQGRSWKQVILQIVMFQLVMRFISPRSNQQEPKDPVTGQAIPPLLNGYPPGMPFLSVMSFNAIIANDRWRCAWRTVMGGWDLELVIRYCKADALRVKCKCEKRGAVLYIQDLYVYVTPNGSLPLTKLSQAHDPVWFLSSEQYVYSRGVLDRTTDLAIRVDLPERLLDTFLHQQKLLSEWSSDSWTDSLSSRGATGVFDALSSKINSVGKLREVKAMTPHWASLYLVAFAVPHKVYKTQTLPKTLAEARKAAKSLFEAENDGQELIARGMGELIEYMKPLGPSSDSLQSLLADQKGKNEVLTEEEKQIAKDAVEKPHWKNHLDIRMVVDHSPLNLRTFAQPHLRRFVQTLPDKGLYLPILHPSDLWLLERNYIELNETMRGRPVELTLSYNSLSMMWWSVQSQLGEVWNPSGDGPVNPLMALQSHSKRETFMLKRVILDTNPYVLMFSGIFMLLHTIFSFLAFKNDVQFWRKNDSVEGLSVLSILIGFASEVVIALYLYDSEETSFLILFEIFLGVALSAWKVTKAINISLQWKRGSLLPSLALEDKKDYEESDTKKYDRVAIKFMSIALLPCMLGYAAYSLKYKKYKSWYSYIISTLAGTVYTFGFIMMTPQLYINYKLKSVDHLPWRAFTYKALNTFVDDIAAFIIDMPWMHRLACFRDDIIFICYLYQRWIYSVDKTRPSEWVSAEETERLKQAAEESRGQGDAVSTLDSSEMTSKDVGGAGAEGEATSAASSTAHGIGTTDIHDAPSHGARRRGKKKSAE